MRKIGIVPGVRLKPDWYEGEYFFKDTFISRIREAGGLPVGMVACHGRIEDAQLELCDAFLMQGGQRILPYHLQVVDYALKHDKPLLGVCLGMQAIHAYFIVQEQMKVRDFQGDYLDLYEQMKREKYYFLEPVENHNSPPQTCYEDENVHLVSVLGSTVLSTLIPKQCEVASRHNYRITKPAEAITVSALASDGTTIEGIEYGDKILGVQFHPELNQNYMPLFKFLTKENDKKEKGTPKVSFRQASIEDTSRIVEIYNAIHAEEAAGKCSTGWLRDVYPTKSTVQAALERGDLYVGESEGRIVGSVILNHSQVDCYADANWEYECPDNQIYVMHTLVIDPVLAGKGYGRAFVKFYEDSAKENHCTELRIDTQEKNVRARAMYRKNGYKEIGVVPCIFNGIPNVQLVLLEKTLL